MRHAFRALRSRNYKIFFIGQGVSLVGTWMQSVAMSWLVYRLTGSATLLGLTAFAALVPGFLLGPFAGVMVDRLDKRRLLMITQSVMMVQAAVLAGLTFAGLVEVWHILALSVAASSAIWRQVRLASPARETRAASPDGCCVAQPPQINTAASRI